MNTGLRLSLIVQSLSCVLALGCLQGSSWAQICIPVEIAQFVPGTGQQDAYFGFSVAVEGDLAIIGVPDDSVIQPHAGAVYVFRSNGEHWALDAVFSSNDAMEGDLFGNSISVSDGVVLIGAPGDNDLGSRSGSAYVFRFNGLNWYQHSKLHASDGGATDYFGASVSLSGDHAVISAERDDDNGTNSGAAYIFSYDGSDWIQNQKLTASDGQEYEAFGASVGISNELAVIGAAEDDDNGVASGSVYLFRFDVDSNSWVQEEKLLPKDGAGGDFFGESVAVSGETLVVGAHRDDDQGTSSGSAYVFAKNGSVWIQQAKLLASDGAGASQFGWSVAIDGDTAVIGANRASDLISGQSGAAYVYARDAIQNWNELTRINASDTSAQDEFANAIAIDGQLIFAGAHAHDGVSTNSGAAYLFELEGCPCRADFNNDQSLDIFDVFDFVDAFNNNLATADINGDLIIDIFDVFGFLSVFNTGCS